MKELFLSVTKGVKGLFREKVNLAIVLLVATLSFGIYVYVKVINRIDYRYNCQKRTIEMVFNVKVGPRGILEGNLTDKQKEQKEQYERELNDYRHHKRRL